MARQVDIHHRNTRRRRHCYNFHNVCYVQILIFLLAGFFSQENGVRLVSSQSPKQSEIEGCLEETESLYGNSFGLAQQVNQLLVWADTQRSTPEAVCIRNANKRTCVLDYVNATGNESSDWCLGVPKTLYIETNFIYRCTNTNDRQMIFYSVFNRPSCYSNFLLPDSGADISASACYNGYDNQIIETIELKTFDELKSELIYPNGNNDGEWGDIANGFENCDQIRFTVTEPQRAVALDSEGSALNCSEATSTIQSAPQIANAVAEIEEELGIVVPNNNNDQLEQQRSNRFLMPMSLDGTIVDYSQVLHNISAVCEETMNGLYLEISYDVICSNTLTTAEAGIDGDDSDASAFQIVNDPLCLSKSACSITEIEYEVISHAASKWNGNIGSTNCQIATASSTDDEDDESTLSSNTTSIIEQKPAVFWEDFSPSQNPTVTPSPTTSIAPSTQPTSSANPTSSIAPSSSPTGLSCMDESMNLLEVISFQDEIEDEDETNRLKMATVVSQIQDILDLLMTGDDGSGEGFEKYCSSSDAGENENGETDANIDTVDAVCDFDYQDVFRTTEIEDPIPSLCKNADSFYVEDSVSITCKSSVGPSFPITKVIIRNKPSCRSRKCSADGVRDVAAVQFQRWIKRTLNNGIADSSSSILAGSQTCFIDETDENGEQGISVTVGTSNDDGPITPSEQCWKGSDFLKSQIPIYNQNVIADQEFMEYLDTDLRQICGSPKPGVLECNFDWSELFPSSEAGTRSNCVLDETSNSTEGCGGGGGQYTESSFRMYCVGTEGEVTMTSRNVPDCMGKPCSPGQTQYLLGERYSFLSDTFLKTFKRFGWTSCTNEVLSVHASHYDPFHLTHDKECYENLQFETIVADGIVVEDTVGIFASDISDLNSGSLANSNSSDVDNVDSVDNDNDDDVISRVEADAPTEAPPTLIGPRYGLLFEPPPTTAPVAASAAARTITVAGTMAIIVCQIVFYKGFILV